MDPLSISASVAGLASTAEMIVGSIYTYVRDFKNAEEEVLSLADELASLAVVLNRLKLVALRLQYEFDIEAGEESKLRTHHLFDCQKTLERIRERLARNDVSKATTAAGRFKRKAKWPFSKTETKETIGDIERHKSTLTLAVNADSMSMLLTSLSRQDDIKHDLGQVRSQLEGFLSRSENKKVLSFLSTIDYQKPQRESLRLRQPGTALWFLEGPGFQSWFNAETAKLWMNGIPGSGKTVLTATVIEEIKNRIKATPRCAVAYAFCDYKDPKSHEPVQILGVLARQLASQNVEAFGISREFYKDHHPEDKDWSSASEESLTELIQEMGGVYEHVFLIVDAVDEIRRDRCAVIDQLQRICDGTLENLKMLFTSRDEFDIRPLFDGYAHVSIAAQSTDLRLYVAAEIEERTRTRQLKIKDPSLKADISNRLVEEAAGMFRWVTCQMDSLCQLSTDRDRREALEKLPVGLDKTYERILTKVNDAPSPTQLMVQRVLKLVALSQGDMSLAGLAQVLSLEPGDTSLDYDAVIDEEDILIWCSSLVRQDESGCVKLAHFTCRTFLSAIDPAKTPEFAPFKLDEVKDNSLIVQLCLTYLCLDRFNTNRFRDSQELEEIRAEFPFRRYAARFWSLHLTPLEDERTFKLLKSLLDPSKPTIFINWSNEVLTEMVGPSDKVEPSGQDAAVATKDQFQISHEAYNDVTTLHLAAMLALPSLCQWLLSLNARPEAVQLKLGLPLHAVLSNWSQFLRVGDSQHTRENRLATIQLLLESDNSKMVATVHRNKKVPAPTLMAARRGYTEAMRLLLKAGAILTKETMELCLEKLTQTQAKEWIDAVQSRNIETRDETLFDSLRIRCRTGKPTRQSTWKIGIDRSLDEVLTLYFQAAKYGQLADVQRVLKSLPKEKIDALDSANMSALATAAKAGHLDVAELLVQHGADVGLKTGSKGGTALHYAAGLNRLDVARFLLASNADPLQQDQQQFTPFHVAAELHSRQIMALMKQFHPELKASCKTDKGMTPLSQAALMGSVDACRYILDTFPDASIAEKTKDGRSMLHLAAYSGSVEVVEYFLAKNCDPSAVNEAGRNALFSAVESRHRNLEVIDILLSHSVSANLPDDRGNLPISHIFAYMDRPETEQVFTRMLREEFDINHTNEDGNTLLHLLIGSTKQSVSGVHENLFDKLLARESSLALKNKEGHSSWESLLRHFSARAKQYQRIPARLLPKKQNLANMGISLTVMMSNTLKRADFDKSMLLQQPEGQSLLSSCIIRNAIWLAEAIIKIDADLIDLKDSDDLHRSPIEWLFFFNSDVKLAENMMKKSRRMMEPGFAAEPLLGTAVSTGSLWLIEKLLDCKADPNEEGAQRSTPLMKAFAAGRMDIIQLMLSRGAEISAMSSFGKNMAHMAVVSNSPQVLDLISNNDIDWTAKCSVTWYGGRDTGVIPLHLAVNGRKEASVRYLLDHGWVKSINAATGRGLTALWLAAVQGHLPIFQMLLDHHANIELFANDDKTTPLHMAAKKGYAPVVRLLLKHNADPTSKDKDGATAAILAKKEGFHWLAATLDKAVMERDKYAFQDDAQFGADGETSLHIAVRAGNMRAIQKHLEAGTDVNARTDSAATPAMLAATNGNLEALQLLHKYGADLQLTNAPGWSPMVHACFKGHTACVTWLLNAGQSVMDRDYFGFTALQWLMLVGPRVEATIKNQLEHLITADWDPAGGSVLDSAAKKCSDEFVDWLMQRLGPVQAKTLLNSVTSPDRGLDATPLCNTIMYRRQAVMEKFLNAGADIELDSRRHGTPLMMACLMGRLEMAKILHGRGANLEAKAMVNGRIMTVEDAAAQHPATKEWFASVSGRHGNSAGAEGWGNDKTGDENGHGEKRENSEGAGEEVEKENDKGGVKDGDKPDEKS